MDKCWMDKWASVIKGLVAAWVVGGLGSLLLVGYQQTMVAGGLVGVALGAEADRTVGMVGKSLSAADSSWGVVIFAAVVMGVAVWLMDAVAQRLGPPYSD